MIHRPVLLLLPGLLCDARLWRDQVAALSADCHCIVADLTHDDSIAAMADRVIHLGDGRIQREERNPRRASAAEISW